MRKLIAAGAAVTVLALAGCVADVPDPVTDPAALVETGSLLQPQADAIIAESLASLAAADRARDWSETGDRVGGRWARLVREAEYAQDDADVDNAISPAPTGIQAVYVSAAETFPRVLVAVSTTDEGIATPWVGLWVQDDIDTPYQLRNWAHMIPGASLPEMPAAATGAQQLGLEDAVASVTPFDAVRSYFELLREGEDSEYADLFVEDAYRERLFTARESLEASADSADGSYSEEFTSDLDATFAMQTADGGALVFAPVSITSEFTVEDATVSVSESEEALLDGELDDRVVHRYRDFVVIWVPPAGSEDLMAVVAAEHSLVEVTD